MKEINIDKLSLRSCSKRPHISCGGDNREIFNSIIGRRSTAERALGKICWFSGKRVRRMHVKG